MNYVNKLKRLIVLCVFSIQAMHGANKPQIDLSLVIKQSAVAIAHAYVFDQLLQLNDVTLEIKACEFIKKEKTPSGRLALMESLFQFLLKNKKTNWILFDRILYGVFFQYRPNLLHEEPYFFDDILFRLLSYYHHLMSCNLELFFMMQITNQKKIMNHLSSLDSGRIKSLIQALDFFTKQEPCFIPLSMALCPNILHARMDRLINALYAHSSSNNDHESLKKSHTIIEARCKETPFISPEIFRPINWNTKKHITALMHAINNYPATLPKGPLFSNYNKFFSASILMSFATEAPLLADTQALLPAQLDHFSKIFPDVLAVVNKEYTDGKNVFFRGEHSQHTFLEKCAKALYAIKNDKEIEGSILHFWLMNSKDLGITKAQLESMPLNTIRQKHHSVAFCTLNLLGNHLPINALYYSLKNVDNTSIKIADAKKLLLNFLMDMGFGKCPNLFKSLSDLYNLHQKLVKESCNTGRLLVISLPQALTEKLVIGFDGMEGRQRRISDVVSFAKNFGDSQFNNEFVIASDTCIQTYEQAHAAGVRIFSFDPFEKSPQYEEYCKKFDEIFESVKKWHDENK